MEINIFFLKVSIKVGPILPHLKFSCGSVVEHCVSSAKVVGSIPREHILTIQMYSLNSKSLG